MKRTTPMPKQPADLALALSAAREAVGSEAAVQRVRSGMIDKIARGTPPATQAGGAWLGKSLGALLLAAGAGALLYSSAEPSPPLAAPRPQQGAQRAQQSAQQAHEPTPLAAPEPTHTELTSPAPEAKPTARPRANTKQRRSTPQPTAATQTPCFDAAIEVDLLSRAQAVLRAQPEAALTLLTEHARRFSCGVLSLERDSLRIDAERALGMDAQARQHARELIAHYPESAEARALVHAADSGSQPPTLPTP